MNDLINEQDIKDFLTTKVLNVHLGTVDERGHANIHPAWFYFDDSKEKIYVATGKYSKKMENLSSNDTVYFCVDDPSPPYKGVRGKGNVKVYYDVNFNILIAQKMYMRYLGNLEYPMVHETIDSIKKGQYVILEISPKYYDIGNYRIYVETRQRYRKYGYSHKQYFHGTTKHSTKGERHELSDSLFLYNPKLDCSRFSPEYSLMNLNLSCSSTPRL